MSRELVSPADRSSIIHAVKVNGIWRGTRQHVRIELQITQQPDLNGNRLLWRASHRRRRYSGQAVNVFDALQTIAARIKEAR